MGHKPGDTIIINKKLLPFKVQFEFLIRIFILDYFILFLQEYFYNILNLDFDNLNKITFIVFEYFLIFIFYERNFRKEIIDLYRPNHLRQLVKKEFPLKIAHFFIFLTYIIAIIISIYSYVGSIGIETVFVITILAVILLFEDFSFKKIKKSEIFRFESNTDKSKSIDNIALDKDITITVRTRDTYKINLLNSELFICENDDILILVSKNHQNNTKNVNSIILPSVSKEILENKRFEKSSIDHIRFGKTIIKFNESSKSWLVT
ncbi:MAG: hypothetical protein LBT06_14540 [Hungatella sp.]|jgi:hypothetical protein|nr:hypothetical protein [Hungatella sp.]